MSYTVKCYQLVEKLYDIYSNLYDIYAAYQYVTLLTRKAKRRYSFPDNCASSLVK